LVRRTQTFTFFPSFKRSYMFRSNNAHQRATNIKSQSKVNNNNNNNNVYSALGPVWQEPEPSQATGRALIHCILGKFLGVVCHCLPPRLYVPMNSQHKLNKTVKNIVYIIILIVNSWDPIE
jgi:hypothetical protein